ncbi:DmsC/YnfH family molybdoenzyme membrane anchor subunit [Bremerella sp. JC817]|uniref:DmsC/YnfH family molybdoenzyme membrane anchor subunit n=1 Tax=Bremerella sp. JC817 TaxID=3231756 RepID=UPI0034575424
MAIADQNSTSQLSSGFDLVEMLLSEQQDLTAVQRFSQRHAQHSDPLLAPTYRELIPLSEPGAGEQYAFEVDLDACSGCKACVVACHNMNGLEESETWRRVGMLQSLMPTSPAVQHVTTACHHCVEPGCMLGCPVQAYEKDPQLGIVVHLDDQCIGCKYCTLMCPYDVPKFSESKGIVRKCDMCRHRLAEGEAPACVQSCPNAAIKITVVAQDAIAAEASEGTFLRGAANPRITKPTTRYIGKNRLSEAMFSAGVQEVLPNHTHLPLVGLLTLTQAALGMLIASVAVQFFFGSAVTSAILATIAAVIGLAASGAHLGRPMYGFRVFLGLRTSWLSREAVLMPGFAGPLVGYAASYFVPMLEPFRLMMGLAAIGGGMITIFCSAMIYIVTRRPFWKESLTFAKFGTTIVLGGFAAASLEGTIHASSFIIGTIAATILVTMARLALEYQLCSQVAKPLTDPLARSAYLILGPLKGLGWSRVSLWAIGGIVLPAILALTSGPVSIAIAGLSLASLVAAELIDRALYFAAESTPAMPNLPK